MQLLFFPSVLIRKSVEQSSGIMLKSNLLLKIYSLICWATFDVMLDEICLHNFDGGEGADASFGPCKLFIFLWTWRNLFCFIKGDFTPKCRSLCLLVYLSTHLKSMYSLLQKASSERILIKKSTNSCRKKNGYMLIEFIRNLNLFP